MTDQYPQDTPIGSEAQAEPIHDRITSAPKRPRRLSSSAARARRAQRNATFEFTLDSTLDEDGNPTTALVRKPALLEADEMRHLPDHMQASIFQMMEETEAFEEIGRGESERAIATLARNYGNITDMVNGYVLRGFVEPRVYATEAEADAHDGVWLQDIDPNDRMKFFSFCTESSREAATVAAPFREQPVDLVDARRDGAAVSGDGQSEPDFAPAGAARG